MKDSSEEIDLNDEGSRSKDKPDLSIIGNMLFLVPRALLLHQPIS